MEQRSESFDDLEAKFFTYVPYHDNDSDITWGFDEKDVHNHSSPYQPKRRTSIQETQDQVKVTPLKEVTALSISNLEIKTSSSKKRRRDQELTEASPGEQDFRDVIKRRRQLVYAKSPAKQDSPVQRHSNIYPNKWEQVQTQTQRRSFSPASTSSYQHQNQNKRRRRRSEGFSSKRSYSLFSSPKPFSNSFNSSTESIESKKLKHNVKLDRSLDSAETVPYYKDYQLLGDSQFVRFSEQLLGYKQLVTYTEDTQSRRIGYCVSGQKINDLLKRISNREFPLAEKLIILIGTNDMIYGTDLKLMEEDYLSMLDSLKEAAKRIVILTVPPVPKLADDPRHISKLKEFNQFLMNCADDTDVFAVDLASLFISYSDTVSTQYFEEFYGSRRRSNSRVDLIHLNRAGFRMLSTVLDVGYFDKHPFLI